MKSWYFNYGLYLPLISNYKESFMARLRYVEKETAGPEQEKILAQLTQKSGKIANMWKLWGHSPSHWKPIWFFPNRW
jgi:hypothetical protein